MILFKMIKEIWRDLSMWSKLGIIISLTVLVGAAVGCNWKIWKKYPQDNIVEEIIEEVIESKTGLDIDLSPNSREDYDQRQNYQRKCNPPEPENRMFNPSPVCGKNLLKKNSKI